jgi:hypothetical protein
MEFHFSSFQLIINEQTPSLEDLKPILDEDKYIDSNMHYLLDSVIIEDRFFWLYSQFGKSLPYSNEVIDNKTKEKKKNPRTEDDIELNKQLFCLYDSITKRFFISNSQKKKFLQCFFKEKLKKDITIKRYFVSPKEFIEKIQKIDKISFTSRNNLFSNGDDIFKKSNNTFGLGEPIDFKLDLNYSGKDKTDVFVDFFNDLTERKKNLEIDSLVCIGRDDNDMESIFDISSYTQTIPLNTKKQDHGLYDENIIKRDLLDKIKEKEV